MSTRCLFVIWLGIVSLLIIDCSKEDALKPVYEWKYLDYDFGSEAARKAAIDSGEYNYKNAVPIDVDRFGNTTFITVIRAKGVPSSLNIVSNKTGPGGPLLQPYPDWSWAKLENCSSITSVYRVAIDDCGKLWVLDNGKVGSKAVCNPQILVFDINTSKLVKRVKIPKHIASNSTTGQGLLVTPVLVSGRSKCAVDTVYIADVTGYALIVYNNTDGSFKRLTSRAFNYDPEATTYTINTESFTLKDGIVGIAHSFWTNRLYFSPMSSYNFDVFNYEGNIRLNRSGHPHREYKNFLCTQSSAKAISNTYVFFGLVGDTAIGCYNENMVLAQNHTDIVAKNSETLQFTSGLKSVPSQNELWALTNRYQKVATGTINYTDVNFRIVMGNVDALVNNTRCSFPPCKGVCPFIPFYQPPLPPPSFLSDNPCGPELIIHGICPPFNLTLSSSSGSGSDIPLTTPPYIK